MILAFNRLRVNLRELEVTRELQTFENGWEVRAKLQSHEDLRYLAGLFATSSEPVELEVETPHGGAKGKTRIAGIPLKILRRFGSSGSASLLVKRQVVGLPDALSFLFPQPFPPRSGARFVRCRLQRRTPYGPALASNDGSPMPRRVAIVRLMNGRSGRPERFGSSRQADGPWRW
jgi:hypothetical protein